MNKSPKILSKHSCVYCNYNTSSYKDYMKHLTTPKHTHRTILNEIELENPNKSPSVFKCDCGKEYSARNSLWYHKKKCNYEENIVIENKQSNNIVSTSDMNNPILLEKMFAMFTQMMTQNQDFMTNVIGKVQGNNTTHTNSHNTNNQFNIQMFLNDHCKNAMNISDFIKSLPITAQHYENTKDNGLADTLTTLMVDGLNNLNVVERPIHCTDQKRKIMYVKDNDKWEKDTNNEIVVKGVKDLTFLHRMNVDLWQEENPKFNTDDDLQIALSSIICNLFSNVTDEKKDLAKLFKGLTDATYLDEDTKTNFTTCDTLASA